MSKTMNLILAAVLWGVFIGFTVVALKVDVQAIGPQNTSVGLATVNGFFRDLIGQQDLWYTLTKLLLVLAFAFVALFAFVGAYQLFTRRNLFEVDTDILLLGVTYVVIAALYVLFEKLALNYRPVILDEGLEASYPSTHVFVIVCVFATTLIQIQRKVWNMELKKILKIVMAVLIVLAIFGRMLSGVHWFTDIVGGSLLSAALVWTYYAVIRLFDRR